MLLHLFLAHFSSCRGVEMDPPAATEVTTPPRQGRQRRGSHSVERILLFSIIFSILFLLKLEPLARNSVQDHNSEIDLPLPRQQSSLETIVTNRTLTSGVGLVTNDGQWDITPDVSAKHDVKIVGFTDVTYIPIAKEWYDRLTRLGYTEHYIAAHEAAAYDDLARENYRVLPCFIENPDRRRLRFFRQIMAARVKLARDMVKNGTNIMLTDVDNVFSRYVNPVGFVEEGYDVYHAYELGYPTHLYHKHGFVICGGHHFFRSSEATMHFLDMAVNKCGKGCDDQVMFNELLWDLDIKWDEGDPPSHAGAKRIISHEADGMNNGKLVESATGRSRLTNHTIKIWDRDFAWRLSGGIPELCPSKNNWIGMPSVNNLAHDKIRSKLTFFDVWDDYCLKPEADEKRVKIACNTSIVDCGLCKFPMCKTCWTDQHGPEKKERMCVIMDTNAKVTDNPFHMKVDWVKLSDGGTVKFCGSNTWERTKISCTTRVNYMVERFRMLEHEAKISIIEHGCKCSDSDR